jgi:histidine triad (HIT) family protein
MSCIFCEIVAGRAPARVVYSDDQLLAFHDISPQAPTHVLLIPRRHVTSLLDLAPEDDGLTGALVRRARDIAREMGFDLLGGRPLGWPPG